ncbi:uncharacterized protein F4812DRAFT_416274 [Daldinia caldariorum]|uniref:uncharacterized protein n=1 Tax=Daldinia caldariorum TaxID=326644 RepID=UPI0020088773|nr:uncharacterized protein F4812DRAFT_416274 [Daldinia caldariorum]KAI1471986.1 hypothetical protein F4812DRAFT_416274 [Daldinia caldariorum]
MSRYEDSRSRGRSSHHRDHSPVYAYSGGDYPISYEEARQLAKTTNSAAADDESPLPPKQLTYEPYPPRSSSSLLIPESRSRPRSIPSGDYRRSSRGRKHERRGRDSDSEYSYDDEEEGEGRTRTPIDKARNFVDNNFSNSTAGLGVGVLGALVGGLAAREAVDATSKSSNGHGHHHSHEMSPDQKRKQLIGTVVGAAVGALGANAVEKRLEMRRERDRVEQGDWERKYRPDHRDRDFDLDGGVEKREVIVARPRDRDRDQDGSGGSPSLRRRDWERDDRDYYYRPRSRSRGVEREVDPEARSWRNVEDWLYDERNENGSGRSGSRSRPRSSGRRSADEEYRYS